MDITTIGIKLPSRKLYFCMYLLIEHLMNKEKITNTLFKNAVFTLIHTDSLKV